MIYPWVISSLIKEGLPPTKEGLSSYIERKLRNVLSYAMRNSPFYFERLGDYKEILSCYKSEFFTKFNKIPCIATEDIVRRHYEFLCVPLGEVQRGYTVETTAGEVKRIFFSQDDLLYIVEAIHHLIKGLNVDKGAKVAVLFPREHEWGVPDLIARATTKAGAVAIQVDSPKLDQQYNELSTLSPYLVIGSAQQIFYLSLHIIRERYERISTNSVIISHGCFPYILSKKVRETIVRAWGMEPLEHFGLAETGFNVALECYSHQGLHVNEADVYAEIIDPENEEPLPPGEAGELVITSLNQKAMPIIRYRTGYLAKMEEGPCFCGDELTRRLKIYSTVRESVDIFTPSTFRLF
ncbi:MAG: hypothetical protein NZ992_04585 [Candidatus Korarchaeum sp.]|nr:hypothetical protein [Candidatus Korarchaeum sp.]